jgi:hypothetical protein
VKNRRGFIFPQTVSFETKCHGGKSNNLRFAKCQLQYDRMKKRCRDPLGFS